MHFVKYECIANKQAQPHNICEPTKVSVFSFRHQVVAINEDGPSQQSGPEISQKHCGRFPNVVANDVTSVKKICSLYQHV